MHVFIGMFHYLPDLYTLPDLADSELPDQADSETSLGTNAMIGCRSIACGPTLFFLQILSISAIILDSGPLSLNGLGRTVCTS